MPSINITQYEPDRVPVAESSCTEPLTHSLSSSTIDHLTPSHPDPDSCSAKESDHQALSSDSSHRHNQRREELSRCLDRLSPGELRAVIKEFGSIHHYVSPDTPRDRLRDPDALPCVIEILREHGAQSVEPASMGPHATEAQSSTLCAPIMAQNTSGCAEKPQHFSDKKSTQLSTPPSWNDLESALSDSLFVKALTQRCTRLSSDPEEVAGITLLILCRFMATDRFDPCRGSVMGLALGVARRVAANMRRCRTRQPGGLPYEPCTNQDSLWEHLVICEDLDHLLEDIHALSSTDQDLLCRGAHYRYCRDYPPMTGTERARLHRLRKKLAEVIDYPY